MNLAPLAWKPRARWLAGVGLVGVIGLVTWLVWPRTEPPRARQYLDVTACLLTDDRGLANPAVTPVWAGMQSASLKTHAQVQYFAIPGPQTRENAVAALNGFGPDHCVAFFAVGDLPIDVIDSSAARYPSVHFYTLGGRKAAANVTPMSDNASGGVSDAVAHIVIDAVERSSR